MAVDIHLGLYCEPVAGSCGYRRFADSKTVGSTGAVYADNVGIVGRERHVRGGAVRHHRAECHCVSRVQHVFALVHGKHSSRSLDFYGDHSGLAVVSCDLGPGSAVCLAVYAGSAGFGDYIFVLDREGIGCSSAFVDLDEIAQVIGLAAAQHQRAHRKAYRSGRGIHGDLARGRLAVKCCHGYHRTALGDCSQLTVGSDADHGFVTGSIGHFAELAAVKVVDKRLFLAYAQGHAGFVEPYGLRRVIDRQVYVRRLVVVGLCGYPDRSGRDAGHVSVRVNSRDGSVRACPGDRAHSAVGLQRVVDLKAAVTYGKLVVGRGKGYRRRSGDDLYGPFHERVADGVHGYLRAARLDALYPVIADRDDGLVGSGRPDIAVDHVAVLVVSHRAVIQYLVDTDAGTVSGQHDPDDRQGHAGGILVARPAVGGAGDYLALARLVSGDSAGIRVYAGHRLVRAYVGYHAFVTRIELAMETGVNAILVKDEFADIHAYAVRFGQYRHLASCGLVVESLDGNHGGADFVRSYKPAVYVHVSYLGIAAGVGHFAYSSAGEFGRKLERLHFRNGHADGVESDAAGRAVALGLDLKHYAVVGFDRDDGLAYDLSRDLARAVYGHVILL